MTRGRGVRGAGGGAFSNTMKDVVLYVEGHSLLTSITNHTKLTSFDLDELYVVLWQPYIYNGGNLFCVHPGVQ